VNGKATLLASLGVLTVLYLAYWVRDVRRRRGGGPGAPRVLELVIGAVSNFFDTLGIGSFAPTTAAFKLCGLVPDERIPGTLNVGQTMPTVTQAFIFIAIVAVDLTTLAAMIAASVAGAWLGAGVVAHWPRRKVQVGMGFALLAAAVLFGMSNLGLLPAGGAALDLKGMRLGVGIIGNFALGALMTLGIGLYAPCMILVCLLGMDPRAAFPIMMGSCAFLMPVGSMRFIDRGSYSLRPALGLAIGGVPAVLLAAYVVKSLPLTTLRWLVSFVVLYASVMMLRSAAVEAEGESRGAPLPAESE
jgi:uncharacterized membrane protein YfcA